MSLLFSQNFQTPVCPQSAFPFHINQIMLCQHQAQMLFSQKEVVYRTLLSLPQSKIQLFWRFEIMKDSQVKVRIRPKLTDSFGEDFRVDTQRGFVEILRAINHCNRDKTGYLSYVLTPFNCIQLCTIYSPEYLKTSILIRRLLIYTVEQLPSSIKKLQDTLQPFLEGQRLNKYEKSLSKTAKTFLQNSYQLLLLNKYNEIKRENEKKCEKQGEDALLSDIEIQMRIHQDQIQSHKKLKQYIKILGTSDLLQKKLTNTTIEDYSQWLRKSKQKSAEKGEKGEKAEKNIQFMKILDQKQKPFSKQCVGAHSKITLGNYKVQIFKSLNEEVNISFELMKTMDGTPLINPAILKIQKKLQLLRKAPNNKQKIEAMNSLQNQIEFMQYIRARSCKFIGSYYLDIEKIKAEVPSIYMELYPHNLRQMLRSQGKYLSFLEKVVMIEKLLQAMNWLSNSKVCHRDLKPQNIMINWNKDPKIIDFGSCCPAFGAQYFRVKQTKLLGTPKYFHQYRKQNMKALFSMRAEYEQHLLFDVYSFGKIMRDIFADGLPHLLPNMEGLLNYMIERCEEENPNCRFTFQELLYLIENIRKSLTTLESQTSF